jgi:hypothetical protein
MNKEFIPYEQALALKELFDEPYLGECFGEYRQWDGSKPYLQLYQDLDGCSTDPADYEYTTECIAPTFSQAFRFFREKYGLFYYVTTHDSTDFEWYIYDKDQNDWEDDTVQNTYEEAELACLKKLIELSTPTA